MSKGNARAKTSSVPTDKSPGSSPHHIELEEEISNPSHPSHPCFRSGFWFGPDMCPCFESDSKPKPVVEDGRLRTESPGVYLPHVQGFMAGLQNAMKEEERRGVTAGDFFHVRGRVWPDDLPPADKRLAHRTSNSEARAFVHDGAKTVFDRLNLDKGQGFCNFRHITMPPSVYCWNFSPLIVRVRSSARLTNWFDLAGGSPNKLLLFSMLDDSLG